MFGVPVSLTYKSDPFIRSTYGGSLTLAARIAVIIILFLQCVAVFNKDAVISSSFYRRNLAVDDAEYTLTLDDFDYAVRVDYLFQDSQPEVANNLELYVSMTTSQAYQTWEKDANGTARQTIKRTLLTLEPCKNGRMGQTANSDDYLSLKQKYLCPPSNFQYSLKGNQASKQQKFISISLRQCNQTNLDSLYGPGVKTCKPYEDRLRVVQFCRLFVILRNSYFEEKNFSDNPTPNFLKPYFLAGRYNSSQLLYLMMSKNEITLHDSMLFGSTVKKTFVDTRMDYQLIQEIPAVDPNTPNPFLQINLIMDDQVKTVERTVTTFVDAIKSTGGMMSVIFTLAMILAQRVQSTIYHTELIKSMFTYQQKGDIKGGDQRLKKQQSLNNSKKRLNLGTIDTEEFDIADKEGLLMRIRSQIANRVKLKYSLAKALCGPYMRYCKKKTMKEKYELELYNMGIEKMKKEFDIRHFVKSMRTLKFISQIMLTKDQREMLPYIKHNLLNYKEKKEKQDADNYQMVEYLKNIIHKSASAKLDKRILKAIEFNEEEAEKGDKSITPKRKNNNKTVDNAIDPAFADDEEKQGFNQTGKSNNRKSRTSSPRQRSIRQQEQSPRKNNKKESQFAIGRITANDILAKKDNLKSKQNTKH